MKKYQDLNWIKQQIFQGKHLDDIADDCKVSRFTISKYFSGAINALTVTETIELSKHHRDIKRVISPKTILYSNIVKLTDYLPPTAPIKQRLWHLATQQEHPPMCKMCSCVVKWDKDNQSYRTYCGTKCQGKDKDINKLREQTNFNKRGRRYWNQTHIPTEALDQLNDKEWLTHEHKTLKKSLMRIGEELGVHPLLPAQYAARLGIVGQQNSTASTELAEFISSIYDREIVLNTRKIISPKELDIYLPEKKIAIEFNGIYWHSELAGCDKWYHLNKTTQCGEKGIRLIHIFEHEWKLKQDIIKSRLRAILNASPTKIMARKCDVVDRIPTHLVANFLNENHIQGYIHASTNVGLVYKDEIVSLMTFDRPRFTTKYSYELIRLCSQRGSVVQGGASKMFNHFVKHHLPTNIVSYSDKSWNSGTVYETLGFVFSHSSNPNYRYFTNNSFQTFSRQKFQKHKLKDKLESFDPSLTEWENMKANGYNRIWDCGNDVWVWKI